MAELGPPAEEINIELLGGGVIFSAGTGHSGCRPHPIHDTPLVDASPSVRPPIGPSVGRVRSMIHSSTKKWVVSEQARSATWAAPSPTDTEIPAGIIE